MTVGIPEAVAVGVDGIDGSKLLVGVDKMGTIVGVRVVSSQVHWCSEKFRDS
jgi:Na+-translocating ferredoxin:NAD+ oxidoreductase RnfG subunit